MMYGSYPNPCETFTYREVENYAITIAGGSNLLPGDEEVNFFLHLDTKDFLTADKTIVTAANKKPDVDPEYPDDKIIYGLDAKVYPNPATSFINLDVDVSNSDITKASVQLFNSQGRIIKEFNENLYNNKLLKEVHWIIFQTGSTF